MLSLEGFNMALPQITATGRGVGTGRRDVSPDAERPLKHSDTNLDCVPRPISGICSEMQRGVKNVQLKMSECVYGETCLFLQSLLLRILEK